MGERKRRLRIRRAREAMIDDALKRTQDVIGEHGYLLGAGPGHCLALAKNMFLVAKEHGIALRLSVGSAYWESAKCGYGYEFAMTMGRPEFHAWLIDEERKEILDPSTRFWPALLERSDGLPWVGQRPPFFLWESFATFEARARAGCVPRYREVARLTWPVDANGQPHQINIEILIDRHRRGDLERCAYLIDQEEENHD